MRKIRAVLLMLALILAAASARAGERGDIPDLQAKLAAQEARLAEQDAKLADQDAALNDIRAKFGAKPIDGENEHPAAIMSIRKNAKITVGGLATAKYQYTQAKINSTHVWDDAGTPADPADDTFIPGAGANAGMLRRATSKTGDLSMSDAELSFQIDVNEHFEAFALLNLQNGMGENYNIAKAYYIRWKNICESGFGIKVGRDALVFGDGGVGELASYAAGSGDGIGETVQDFQNAFGGTVFTNLGYGVDGFAPRIIPMHNGWDVSGVTQITPYWEGMDGKLSFELSLMQNIYEDTPGMDVSVTNATYLRNPNKIRSRNYGIGTASARVVYTPIEDLKFTLSAANYRSNGTPYTLVPAAGAPAAYGQDQYFSKNNPVLGLAASYRPCWFNKLFMWAQWVHGQDVYFIDGLKSDAVNFGLSFDLAEGLTIFAQADYLKSKYAPGWSGGAVNESSKALAFYTGLSYSLPTGVSFEAGWKHEKVNYKANGLGTVSKAKADTIYGLVGFEF